MKRFLEYYRQFEELAPEEVSRELRVRRDEEKARALTEQPALDLASPAWHEPPHPEIVNAATFALRRAVNAYPDAAPDALADVLAARHGLAGEQVAVGHGASELLRAACLAVLARANAGGEVAIAWPGWGPLPRLVHEAGGRPVPVRLGRDGAADVDALLAAAGPQTSAVALASPNDPTGGTVDAAALRRLADGLPGGTWILLDAALADFEAPDADLAPLTRELDRLLVFRSFSKAHAMAGFRAGYAIGAGGDGVAGDLLARLAPPLGVSAPAQAGMAWAAANGERYLPRRRAAATAERERLAAALAGSELAFPAGTGPLAWLSSAAHDGPTLAAHLASHRIFVSPGTAWGDDRHVRLALRGPEATERLAGALAEL